MLRQNITVARPLAERSWKTSRATAAASAVPDPRRQRLWRDDGTNAFIDSVLPAMESGTATPFTVADEILSRSGHLLTRT